MATHTPAPEGSPQDADAQARSERIRAAVVKMREVAEHTPPGTDGTAIIRHFRDAAEPWLTEKRP
ncbi:MAG: hypothetical protein Q8S43_04480 [Actinomycetota bacterium]|nr:MAG: hypothetical protein FD171_1992 [Actinomycetota bacterium]MDO8950013.1 hypothetical protein [Actinomycetota bacterium]MDP3630194.1 hypothetical protein [Actinomycetota bacterium]